MENEALKEALLAGLIDSEQYEANDNYGPKLITNNATETVWEYLQQELLTCQKFVLAPAFITSEMLVALKITLAQLSQKGVHGTILTSDYLGFNTPEMFTELLKLPNVTVKIVQTPGFHAKGYFFWHKDHQTAYIGSSNFTRQALLKNSELNLKISSQTKGRLAQEIFTQLANFEQEALVLDQTFITNYRKNYVAPVIQRPKQRPSKLAPNKMQTEALKKLQILRTKEKAKKALIISATGTGKTYLGAFDVKNYAPKRFLYVVHREQILHKTLESFQKVLGGARFDYGIYGGGQHEKKTKYVFATIQALARPENLAQFAADEFDYILVDEAHHVGAASYQRLMAHFEPAFWLGMTATPERMDDFDVYQAFDHQIAYEISLEDALAEEMLCPFDYIGVTDYEFLGETVSEKATLSQLTAPERVKHILKQLAYYGNETSRGGLVFCSRQDEAKALAKAFSAQGYPSLALTNNDSSSARKKAVQKLEAGQLKYLITVDIFNEGIDIPCVDQVVLLRNTQSKIVFAQQLGRGLRRFPQKESVLVLDFIGNYKNNYLIPQALTNDRFLNKDRLLADLKKTVVYHLATINFDLISRQRIFEAIASTKLDALKRLRQSYERLKKKLGRTPWRYDFYQENELDPQIFTQNQNLNGYYALLKRLKVVAALPKKAEQYLYFLENELLNGKRKHELLLLEALLAKNSLSQTEFRQLLRQNNCYCDEQVLASVQEILSLRFFAVKAGKTLRQDLYGKEPLIVVKDATYMFNETVRNFLQLELFKTHFIDIIKTGLALSAEYASERRFTLYQKYTRKDVCRLLDWRKDISAPLYGYRVVADVCPIFITYRPQTLKHGYQNEITNNEQIKWYTRSPRSLASKEVQELLAQDEQGRAKVQLPLFIKPTDAFQAEFYYVGQATIDPKSVQEEELLKNGKKRKAVSMKLCFEKPLPLWLQAELKAAEHQSQDRSDHEY
ncbi:DEAD/DEAH box helicase [Ligilactobacillus faecis]|uniref:DEAD/DEAH box helicase n=1 Tax=Ligilactobacillus faecis TaxID=762833 RepID=UPI0024697931|nr:DEAD/DEAH box helicase [Ligilactobacillus faecis]WGN88613.1 DEAD/DEAH box helicase [Ligilactobacillus faecis]